MKLEAPEVTIRRVDYRHGSDAELAAQYVVESEIEAERRPDRPPQPQSLESFIGFARNLPSQFEDHTWLAQTSDRTPVGCAGCWSNTAGDPAVMEVYVYVRKRWRRQGIGWRLIRPVVEVAETEGRSNLVGNTFGTIPAGQAFAQRLGARVARVNRNSELPLSDVDWDLVASWTKADRARTLGYRLDVVDGPFPPELVPDAVAFQYLAEAAPRDDLPGGAVVIRPDDVIEADRALVEAGRDRWMIFVRDSGGQCVGGTAVTFESGDAAIARQGDTAIDESHRGHGLAKWAKAAMLDRIRRERPQVERLSTSNAFSNAPMLAINDKLGFKITETWTEWRGETPDLRGALPALPSPIVKPG